MKIYRNFNNLDKYLNRLSADIYPQPEDSGHRDWEDDAIRLMFPVDVYSMLDVGCGEGVSQEILDKNEMFLDWRGITLGEEDYQKAKKKLGADRVYFGDFSFLSRFKDGAFDLVYSRHSLEHSPMPLISLMEWNRISRHYLFLVSPAPEYWKWSGKNHYSMMNKEQIKFFLELSKWKILIDNEFTTSNPLFLKHYNTIYSEKERVWREEEKVVEYRFLCEKENE